MRGRSLRASDWSSGGRGTNMRKSTLLKALLSGIASTALLCATTPALAQHGGGHGGGGGGFHGGGGGGFHGGYGGGYHGGYGGGYHGGPAYSGPHTAGPGAMHGSAPSGMHGGTSSPRGFTGSPQGRGAASNAHVGRASSAPSSASHMATAHSPVADGQWHSFASGHTSGSGTGGAASSARSAGSHMGAGANSTAASHVASTGHAAVADGRWHSMGNTQ